MAEIRFTLGDLDEWHVIHLDYELTKEKFKDIHDLSYIIKREQKKRNIGLKAKKVKVFNDQGILLASSSNILEDFKLDYYNEKNNKNEKD